MRGEVVNDVTVLTVPIVEGHCLDGFGIIIPSSEAIQKIDAGTINFRSVGDVVFPYVV